MMTIALNLLDIAGNCFEAGASDVLIKLEYDIKPGELKLIVSDNGKGMDRETVEKVTDPFYTTRTTRKVGMGIPLLKQQAEASGGGVSISSVPGEGTSICAIFGKDHPDRQPLGDIAGVVVMLAARNNDTRVRFICQTTCGKYEFDNKEVKEVLEIENLNDPGLQRQLRELVQNGLLELKLNA